MGLGYVLEPMKFLISNSSSFDGVSRLLIRLASIEEFTTVLLTDDALCPAVIDPFHGWTLARNYEATVLKDIH